MLTFPSRGPDGDSVARIEQSCLGDGVVYLCLEHIKEALFAYLLACLWALQDGPGSHTEGTRASRRHDRVKGHVSADRSLF
jgi:hypothetical protein